MAVFEATLDDIFDIAKLGECFHREAPEYRDLPYSRTKVAAWAAMHVNDPEMNVWIARNDQGVIVGGIFGQIHETYFGSARQAIENTYYVHPHYRGGRTAVALLRTFIKWAEEHKVQRAIVTISSGIETSRTARFLGHFGFEPAAIGFVKEIG